MIGEPRDPFVEIGARCLQQSTVRRVSDEHVVETMRELLPIPVLTGLPFGHVAKKLTLPFGAVATLNIAPGSFTLSY